MKPPFGTVHTVRRVRTVTAANSGMLGQPVKYACLCVDWESDFWEAASVFNQTLGLPNQVAARYTHSFHDN